MDACSHGYIYIYIYIYTRIIYYIMYIYICISCTRLFYARLKILGHTCVGVLVRTSDPQLREPGLKKEMFTNNFGK